MEKKRKAYAPFSLTSEAGVGQTPVEGYIDVNQMIYPSVDTGVIDENGQWQGVRASDNEFKFITKDEAIADGAAILTPSINPDGSWPLDMTGFNDLFIAVNTSRSGNYEITAVMGPNSFANLTPINDAATLKGSLTGATMGEILNDSSEALTAGKWDIFIIQDRLRNQKHLQFKITNNSGGEAASIECGFMRMV